MGSSPSVVDVPEGHMVGDGQTTRRYQGFQEVEMADPEGHVGGSGAGEPSHTREQMQRAADVALHADDPLEAEGADLYSVVGQMQRQKTTMQMADPEFEQPNYDVKNLSHILLYVKSQLHMIIPLIVSECDKASMFYLFFLP